MFNNKSKPITLIVAQHLTSYNNQQHMFKCQKNPLFHQNTYHVMHKYIECLNWMFHVLTSKICLLPEH